MARLSVAACFLLSLAPVTAFADPEERKLTPFQQRAEETFSFSTTTVIQYGVIPGFEMFDLDVRESARHLKSFPDELLKELRGTDAKNHRTALEYLADRACVARSCAWLNEHDQSERPFRKLLGKYAKPYQAALEEVLKRDSGEERALTAAVLLALNLDHPAAIEILTAELRSNDIARRKKVCEWAGDLRLTQEKVISALIENIGHSKSEVRAAAAKAVWKIGPKAVKAVPALIELLNSGDAANAKVVPFPPLFLHEVPANVALLALAEMGADAKPAVPVVAEMLKLADKDKFEFLIYSLTKLGPDAKEAAPALAEMLKDAKEDKLFDLLEAMAAIGPEARPALAALRKKLASDQHYERMLAAATILCIDPKPSQALEMLITALKDDDRVNRNDALNAIAHVKPKVPELVPLLAASLTDRASPPFRIAGSQYGDRDSNSSCAQRSLKSMGTIAEPALPAMVDAIVSEIRGEGSEYRLALARMQEPFIKTLMSAILKVGPLKLSSERREPEQELSPQIARQMAKDSPQIVSKFIKDLSDKDADRWTAAVFLGMIRCREAKEALKGAIKMDDGDELSFYAVIAAGWALAQLED
jgi:hypothetical protein